MDITKYMNRYKVVYYKCYNPLMVPSVECDICGTSLLGENKPRYGVEGWEGWKNISYHEVCSEECVNMVILQQI